MTDNAKTVLAELLDWLAQHGLSGPTATVLLMQRAYDALAASLALVEALEGELREVLDVALARGEDLGYADDNYRNRLAAMQIAGWEPPGEVKP
jgi:hypothetical protein